MQRWACALLLAAQVGAQDNQLALAAKGLVTKLGANLENMESKKEYKKARDWWLGPAHDTPFDDESEMVYADIPGMPKYDIASMPNQFMPAHQALRTELSGAVNELRKWAFTGWGGDEDDRTEGYGGYKAAQIPMAKADQEAWQAEARSALKEVEKAIPPYVARTKHKVMTEIKDSMDALKDGFKDTKAAWDETSDRMSSVRDNTKQFENMFDRVAKDLRMTIIKANQSLLNTQIAGNDKVEGKKKRLLAGLSKRQNRAVARLDAITQSAKGQVARYMADTPLKYKKLEREAAGGLNEVSTRLQDTTQSILEKMAKANTKGEKSRAMNSQTQSGLATMNQDRTGMAGVLQGDYDKALARMDARVATERKMTNTVSQSLLNELTQTFKLAQKTIEAEGKDAKQRIIDEHRALMGNAGERVESIQDEIKSVHRNINKIVDQGKVGMRKLEQWITAKKAHLSDITEQGDLIVNMNGTIRDNLRVRNLEMEQANNRLWKFIDDPQSGQIQKTAEAIQRAENKLADELSVAKEKLEDDYDIQKQKVLGGSPNKQLQLENFTEGLDQLLVHYRENFLTKVQSNLSTASYELKKLVDETVPAVLREVTDKAMDARNQTEDEREEVQQQAAKVTKYLGDELGRLASKISGERSSIDKLAEEYRDYADSNVTAMENDVSNILDNAKTEFDGKKTTETTNAHFLVDKAKDLMGLWASDMAKAAAKQNQLRVAASELSAEDQRGVESATKATQDTTAELKKTIKSALEEQVAAMVEKQKAFVPLKLKEMDGLQASLHRTESAQAEILSQNIAKADATLQQQSDILHKYERNQDEMKNANGAFLQKALANVDAVKGQVNAQKLLAKSSWKQRKQMLASKIDSLDAELKRRYQFSDADTQQQMAAATEAAKKKLEALVLKEDGSTGNRSQTNEANQILTQLTGELSALHADTADADRGVQTLQQIQQLADEASASVTAETGDVKASAQAQNVVKDETSSQESQELSTLAQQTSDILDMVRKAEEGVDGALTKSREDHKALTDQVSVQVNEIKERARLAGQKVKERVAALNTNVLTVEKELKKGEMRMGHLLDGSKSIVTGSLAHVAQGLRQEKEHLKEGASKVIVQGSTRIGKLLQGLNGLTGKLSPLMDEMQERMDRAETDEARWTASFDKAESLQRQHTDEEVEEVAQSAREANLAWNGWSHWRAGFSAKDMAWKEIVHSQLQNYGVELNGTVMQLLKAASGIEASSKAAAKSVEGEVDSELSALERETNGKIDQLFAESDAKIAAILANENLSDKEKEELVAKIEAEAHAKRLKILAEQAELQRKQAALQAGLEHYQVLVAAAKDATKRAVESGMLAPTVKAVQDNLHNVTAQIHEMKTSSYLLSLAEKSNSTVPVPPSPKVPTSLLQSGHSSISEENEALAAANARLAARIATVEQQLA